MIYIEPEILDATNTWLTPTFDEDTQHQIKELIANNPDELKESFYKNLAFGTGGMRGIMGVGTNRINKYTLGKNTQGLANYLKQQNPHKDLSVVIAYDCRNNSNTLAKVVANVFSANNIKVYLFSELRPTPELSFAVKHLDCDCGIVLTASHNPPEYNGYKVYWADGGQIVPPQDTEIIETINDIDYTDIKFDANEDLIEIIDQDIDNAFINASVKNGSFQGTERDNLNIVFTSLHGTSITTIPETLKRAGYKNVHIVEEQAEPDGNFPTVKSPNPEEPEALEMAMKLAHKVNADIVIGTDPDSDRLGIAVRNHKNEMVLLNGNQTMIVMTDFLIGQWLKQGKLSDTDFIGSTIVSTPMMQELANYYGIECKVGLTGFKWIAKMIKDFPKQAFIGGGEESFGFMVGDFVRDKDAVTATLLACEIASQAKSNNSTFYNELLKLYEKHGCYKEHLVSLTKKGISGAEEIKQMMIDFRNNPPATINNSKVVLLEDYQSGTAKDLLNDKEWKLEIPKSNVLIYYTEDGSKIACRPSGTEPKIKFYMSVKDTLDDITDFEKVNSELDNKIAEISNDLKIH
ncbi:phospho-sugar mutase [Pseudofulvibacter geojedonensis]|uniref:Phospho-sugar mutase n=1 Tax=Pseudofulvibacter geojedonensis TaxID=1123758 RepID=A0ABW3HZ62_9FLAO